MQDPQDVTVTECRCGRLKCFSQWKFPHELDISRETLLELEDIARRYVNTCPVCEAERKERTEHAIVMSGYAGL
jgi:hypothetical protein